MLSISQLVKRTLMLVPVVLLIPLLELLLLGFGLYLLSRAIGCMDEHESEMSYHNFTEFAEDRTAEETYPRVRLLPPKGDFT